MQLKKLFFAVSPIVLILFLAGCKSDNAVSGEPPTKPQVVESEIVKADPFIDAINKAIEAAKLTQTAKTPAEWTKVAISWQQSISLLKTVPVSSSNYKIAQRKAVEYETNLEYAQKNSQATIKFKLSGCEKAMKTAAAVSKMQDKGEDIDPAIRSCGSMKELIAASSKFPSALDGEDETIFVSNRCTYNSSLKSTPICNSILPTLTTIHYLAVNSEIPTPDDPVPVSDQKTIKMLIAAAQRQNREKYNSIAASSSVELIPAGAIVDVVSTSGELVQVKLSTRDVKGNDLSGQVRWTHSKFVQNRQMKF